MEFGAIATTTREVDGHVSRAAHRQAIVGDVARPGSPLTSARFGQLASLLPDCGSTQDIIRGVAGTLGPEGFVAVTDHQIGGRGRRGRTWEDRPGESLMFSLLLRPETPLEALAAITLAVGVAIAEALPVEARVRWPNDIVIGGAKIAGVLTELETPDGRDPYLIVGIGINANTAPDGLPETDRLPATSLLVETGCIVDRLALLHRLLDRIQAAYREFEELGFAALFDRYAALDDLAHREVTLQLGDGEVTGTCKGVDAAGRLVLAIAGADDRRFDAGEVVRVGST